MLKKTICSALAVSALLLVGCSNSYSDSVAGGISGGKPYGFEMKSLAEIRSETENVSTLAGKFNNLDLSETFIYVPDVDKIDGFSLVFDSSTEDKKKLLLDTAEWLMDETGDDDNLSYLPPHSVDEVPFAEYLSTSRRDEGGFMYYRSDKLYMGINIGGNYTFAANNAADNFFDTTDRPPHWIDNQEPVKNYDLFSEENMGTCLELQDGKMTVSEAVDFLRSDFENSPLNIDELKVMPYKAGIYKVGEKYGISVGFSYEYNGVLLDYHNYVNDVETGKYDFLKKHLNFDISMVWKNRTDQLYGTKICTVKSTGESCDEFISFEGFLSIISEKLTGNSKFTLDTVELLNGLAGVYPDEFYTAADEEKPSFHLLSITSHPTWVAYISNSGIAEAPTLCVVMDATTGEVNVYRSYQ